MIDWLASLNWGGSMTPLGLAIVLALLVIAIVVGVDQRR
jgi:hypothetical protein